MKLPGSSNTKGNFGGFKEVVPAGYVLGLISAEAGKTGQFSKNPGEDKLVFNFDIVEGDLAFEYKSWTDRDDGKNHYLQLHVPLSNMAKIVYILEHLAKETGGKAEQVVRAAIKSEEIDETKMGLYKLKTGAKLGYSKKGYIEIKELLSVDEGRNMGLTGEKKPVPEGGSQTYGNVDQDAGFGAEVASGDEDFEGGF